MTGFDKQTARSHGSVWAYRAARFLRKDDGSVTLFACFMIMMMVLVGGIGVDLMHNEMERTRLQAVIDRAVLAAADLDQELDPQSVVEDYFAKSGMEDFLTNVTVSNGLNYRTVTANARTTTETRFMKLMGTNELPVPASAVAEERVAKVEISLIVDISGSMARNSRLDNLKDAAGVFVDTVIRPETQNLISLSIIPYSAHVNAGPGIFNAMNVNDVHTYSHCIEFPDSHFDSAALSSTHTFEQMQHFQHFNPGWNDRTRTVCPRYNYERIRAFSQDANAIKTQINQLQPRANTSIFLGMKWGVALLDPSFRTINDTLVAAGTVDASFAGRPAEYGDSDTLKTVILMTDGQNVATSRIKTRYYNSESEVVHWNNNNLDWYISNVLNRGDHWRFRSTKYSSSKGDQLLSNVCDAAKAEGIVIWAIGFEAPTHGANTMRDCASTPSHFFRVEGIELTDAFRAIARQINQLRLTQ